VNALCRNSENCNMSVCESNHYLELKLGAHVDLLPCSSCSLHDRNIISCFAYANFLDVEQNTRREQALRS
jgi:hypothetical protein